MWLHSQKPVVGNVPFRLREGSYLLGRSAECDIIIGDRTISRRHARLTCLFSTVIVLEDLASANGTIVGETRIALCDVVPPCTIRFGRVELDFVTTLPLLQELQVMDTKVIPSDQIATSDLPQVAATLTRAQREVLAYLRKGLDGKRIAARLDRSPHTIHNHIREIYAALGVHSRAELCAMLPHRP